MAVEVTYKGATIGSLSETGTITLETQGTWVEDDITIDNTADPIPSNYGLITWNGSVLTVS